MVAINDITDAATLAHLLKYDSSYGTYDQEVSSNEHAIIVDGKEIPAHAEQDPHNITWEHVGVGVVNDTTRI